jgi:Na+/melibiose symporter-like transporter
MDEKKDSEKTMEKLLQYLRRSTKRTKIRAITMALLTVASIIGTVVFMPHTINTSLDQRELRYVIVTAIATITVFVIASLFMINEYKRTKRDLLQQEERLNKRLN